LDARANNKDEDSLSLENSGIPARNPKISETASPFAFIPQTSPSPRRAI
jgi:hypothetical protein